MADVALPDVELLKLAYMVSNRLIGWFPGAKLDIHILPLRQLESQRVVLHQPFLSERSSFGDLFDEVPAEHYPVIL